MSLSPFFLPTPDGQRFCIHHPSAQKEERGAVVYLHPFAEEMHKSRRMAALQSRALAKAGFHVLQIDLLGCGDSSGDFGDATWEAWQDDACRAVEWLQGKTSAPLWLWGLRTGALLAADTAIKLDLPARLAFWNPVTSGKQYLQQFLRLKLASEMMSGDAKGAMEIARHTLESGKPVEIAGYLLNAAMAKALDRTELKPNPAVPALYWLETSPKQELSLSPAAQIALEKWIKAGNKVEGISVHGPTFWQTTEIEDAPALIEATVSMLTRE